MSDNNAPEGLKKATGNPIVNCICQCGCLLVVLTLEAIVGIWALVLYGQLPKQFTFGTINAGCKIATMHSFLLAVGILTLILIAIQIASNVLQFISNLAKAKATKAGEDEVPKLSRCIDSIVGLVGCVVLGLFITSFVFICCVFSWNVTCGNAAVGETAVMQFVQPWAITSLVLGIIDLVLILLICVCVCCFVVLAVGLASGMMLAQAA